MSRSNDDNPPKYKVNGDECDDKDSHPPLPPYEANPTLELSQLPYSSSSHFKSEDDFNSSFGIHVYSSVKNNHYSSSRALNNNSNTLSSFLLYYNRYSPILKVKCRGTHEESRSRTTTDSDGNTTTEYYNVTVTDFSYNIDLTTFLHDNGAPNIYSRDERVTLNNVLHPAKPEVCADQTAMEYDELVKCKLSSASNELINSYIRDGNPLKRIELEKEVHLDRKTLRKLIYDRIRELGYRHTIHISFPMKRNRIKVRNGTLFSFFGNTKEGRFCCFCTCLCVLFLPAYLITKYCCYKEKNRGKEETGDSDDDIELFDEIAPRQIDLDESDFKNKKEYKKAVKKMRKQLKKEAKENERQRQAMIEQMEIDKKKKERRERIQNGKSQQDSCTKHLKCVWSAPTAEEIYLRIESLISTTN
eukprot:Nk52_evm24s348 gene=Nk52_evmTU24s348